MSTCKKIKVDPYLLLCTNLKSKWTKNINIKPDTLSLIEDNVGTHYLHNLEQIGTGTNFLNRTFTQFYSGMPTSLAVQSHDQQEKKYCPNAFSSKYSCNHTS